MLKYPWPQLIKEDLKDGVKSYNVTYPGDPNVINSTEGYLFDEWPEIEFVEDRQGHDFRYSLDVSKLLNIGFTLQINFRSGLESLIENYK